MLRKLSLIVFMTTVYGAEVYKGCADSEKEARINLAQNISVNIESSSLLKKENSSIFGIKLFSSTFKKESKQTTNLELRDVNIEKQNNKICATISNKKLLQIAKSLVKKVKIYDKSILPKYEKDKVVKINEILKDIKNSIVLAKLYPKEFSNDTIKLLEEKQTYFTNLRKKYKSQFAKITIIGDYSQLTIDGKSQKANKEIFLDKGKHKFSVASNRYCNVEKEFELKDNKDFETIVNLNNYKFPYMLISANKDDAKLTIDGKSYSLGKKRVFKRCDGTSVGYSVVYEGQKENGTLELLPNEYVEKNYTFYSKEELRKFKTLALKYASKTKVEIKYGYMIPSANSEYENYESLHTVQLNYINTKKVFRYGYGILYGMSSSSEDEESSAYELYYNLGLQLNSVGDSALHIGSIVVVPTFDIQIGFGSHTIYNIDTNSSFEEFDGTDDFSWKNNGILKAGLGIDFVVNDNIGVNIFAQKQFTMEESVIFGTGLIIAF